LVRALIIGPVQKDLIRALKKRAAENVISFNQVKLLAGVRERGTIRNPLNYDLTIEIPQGYLVTYTHEMQREDVECRHISISVRNAEPNKGPNPTAVELILKEFGFVSKIGEMPSILTKDHGDFIVEFVEPINGNMLLLMKKPT
jgi:hypothetical protein